MSIIEDYILCILALAVLIWETWLVAKRNRTIRLKGKDDFFTLCIVMLFAMLFLRPELDTGFLTSLRNTLVLMAIFFSMAVKRGVSERGFEKLGFVIRWNQIAAIQIEPYQTSKLVVYFQTEKHRFKLFFPKYQLQKVIYEIQQYYPRVMVADSLKL